MLEISCKRMFVAILVISLLITLGCTDQQETGSQEEEKIHMAVSDQTSQYNASSKQADSIELTESHIDSERYTSINSSISNVSLLVPNCYKEEVIVDTPYYYITKQNEALCYNTTLFSFFDHNNYENGGLIWAIYTRSVEERNALMDDENKYTYILNSTTLGCIGDTVYTIVYFAPQYLLELQFDNTSRSSTESYYHHLVDGLEILDLFVVKNGLAQNKDWGDWKSIYTERLIKPMQEIMNSV